jgi:peptide/nickel transport system substrate-binding protein
MRIHKKSRSLIAMLFAASAMCGTATIAAAQAPADTLVVAIPGMPQGLDFDRDVSPLTWSLGAQVFDQGMDWAKIPYPYDAETPAEFSPNQVKGFGYPAFREQILVPGLMEACQLSEDSLTATYKIRPGVVSAYGNEFDSADVMWRVERAAASKAIDWFIQSLANTADLKKWSVVDKYTVQVKSDTPIPLGCAVLTNIYFPFYDSDEIKKHATEADPWGNEWISKNGGGFGAYYVKSWEPGKRVVMEANPNYWGGELTVKKIVYVIVPEAASRLALLEQGKVHIAETLSPDDLKSIVGSDKVAPIGVRGNQSIFATMNASRPPFDNLKIRQAVNMLIPRDEIAKGVFNGLAFPWSGVMPTVFPGAADLPGYKFDVAAAKALVAESGVDLSKPITLSFNASDAVQENIAIQMQRTFKEAGITLELKKLPIAAHADEVMGRTGQISLWVDMAIQPDPSYALGLLYATGGATNYFSYSNPAVDEQLAIGREKVGQARLDAHQEVQSMIQKDAPAGWIAEQFYTLALSKKIEGLSWYPAQYYKVRELKISN